MCQRSLWFLTNVNQTARFRSIATRPDGINILQVAFRGNRSSILVPMTNVTAKAFSIRCETFAFRTPLRYQSIRTLGINLPRRKSLRFVSPVRSFSTVMSKGVVNGVLFFVAADVLGLGFVTRLGFRLICIRFHDDCPPVLVISTESRSEESWKIGRQALSETSHSRL